MPIKTPNRSTTTLPRRPNIICVFADQMRAQATGYAGDPNVRTPHLDALSRESAVFETAVSTCPICTPARACLLTGRYPLSTGVFLNDVALPTNQTTIAHATKAQGYDTAYIGKWHLDGTGHKAFTPPGRRRQGFDFWAAYNMGHSYYKGFYYRDTPERLHWKGYEPESQTKMAIDYIRSRDASKPFCLFLSYGPPHDPYDEVPAKYRRLYSLDKLKDRPNFLTPYTRDRKKMKKFAEEFPIETHRKRSTIYRGVIPDIVREELLGYYAHITALDEYVGRILRTLKQCGLDQDTIFLFTSDHGDMLGSQRKFAKQWPYDESVRVPFLLRYPKKIKKGRRVTNPIGTVDVMPTLLGLAGLEIPGTVEGSDLSHTAVGPSKPSDSDAALTMCISPFVSHPSWGMREYRGIRTARYTYARTLEGPWLLFDNQKDPYQLKNLVRRLEHSALQRKLDGILSRNLRKINDSFEPAEVYRERAGIHVVKDDNAIPVRKTE